MKRYACQGVPFSASISPLSQSYFPNSFKDKWKGVDKDLASEITGSHNEYGYGGWEHSAVC